MQDAAPKGLLAITVRLAVPADVGVPPIIPVEEFSVNPAGSVPLVTLHTIGPVPDALNFSEYAVPTRADGKVEGVVREGAAFLRLALMSDASGPGEDIVIVGAALAGCAASAPTARIRFLRASEMWRLRAPSSVCTRLTVAPPVTVTFTDGVAGEPIGWLPNRTCADTAATASCSKPATARTVRQVRIPDGRRFAAASSWLSPRPGKPGFCIHALAFPTCDEYRDREMG